MLGDWFGNFLIRTGNEENKKHRQERCTKLVYLIFWQKVADHAHPAAVCCSVWAVADWCYSWPMASTLANLCLSQRRTFWTYVVTINQVQRKQIICFLCTWWTLCFTPCLMQYKSMKCDVWFSQGRVHTIFRWGGHFSYMSKNFSSSLHQCKNYKNRSRFSKVIINNVLPPFLWFTVYMQRVHRRIHHISATFTVDLNSLVVQLAL